jgi:hypothetical protein
MADLLADLLTDLLAKLADENLRVNWDLLILVKALLYIQKGIQKLLRGSVVFQEVPQVS